MRLIVNGEPVEAEARTLESLLVGLGFDGNWCAAALNSEFVPRAERSSKELSEGDRIEILTPHQGG